MLPSCDIGRGARAPRTDTHSRYVVAFGIGMVSHTARYPTTWDPTQHGIPHGTVSRTDWDLQGVPIGVLIFFSLHTLLESKQVTHFLTLATKVGRYLFAADPHMHVAAALTIAIAASGGSLSRYTACRV